MFYVLPYYYVSKGLKKLEQVATRNWESSGALE